MTDWVMPEWMEPHRDHFNGTGGNTVERLMTLWSDRAASQNLLFSNRPLYICMIWTAAQVEMLTAIHTNED